MGYLLYRMLRVGMPAEWTSGERLVALIIADDCNDQTRTGWITNAQLCEETGLSAQGVATALRKLGRRGFEMRIPAGIGKDGRPVYAARGHATTYLVPMLAPRPVKASPQRDLSEIKASPQQQKASPQRDPSPQVPSVQPSPQKEMGVPSSHLQVERNGQPDENAERNRQLDGLKALIDSQPPEPAVEANGETSACTICGTEFEAKTTGRPRLFCSGRCRMRAHRAKAAT